MKDMSKVGIRFIAGDSLYFRRDTSNVRFTPTHQRWCRGIDLPHSWRFPHDLQPPPLPPGVPDQSTGQFRCGFLLSSDQSTEYAVGDSKRCKAKTLFLILASGV